MSGSFFDWPHPDEPFCIEQRVDPRHARGQIVADPPISVADAGDGRVRQAQVLRHPRRAAVQFDVAVPVFARVHRSYAFCVIGEYAYRVPFMQVVKLGSRFQTRRSL